MARDKTPTKMLMATVDRVPWDYEILGTTYADSGSYEKLLQALEKNATSMGADAVIGLRLVSSTYQGSFGITASWVAYGTAVKRTAGQVS